jgi:D-threo-aldose 1-dehydrogenase
MSDVITGDQHRAELAARLGPLAYGAASIGNLYRAVDDDQAVQSLQAAWDNQIRYFDTAPHYGLGASERRLGAFLQHQPRTEFVISTKVGRRLVPNLDFAGGDDLEYGFAVPNDLVRVFDPTEAGIRQSLESSLERLGLDRVDIVYLHDPDVYDLDRGLAEGLPALESLRAEGLVDQIGIGTNSTEAAIRAVREGNLDLVMLAGRYTLLEQQAAIELLPLCFDRGVGLVDAAPFNSGLLATGEPSRGGHYNYTDAPADIVAHAERLAAVCRDFDVELPAAALQFPLRHRAVCTVVAGAASSEHVRKNAERMQATIPEEFWAHLAAVGLVVDDHR